jgi:hypothetical protein
MKAKKCAENWRYGRWQTMFFADRGFKPRQMALRTRQAKLIKFVCSIIRSSVRAIVKGKVN